MRRIRRLPLSFSFTVAALAYMAVAALLALVLEPWLHSRWAAAALAVLLPLPLLLYHVHRLLAPAHSLFRALAGSVASYRDGDYSFGVSWEGGGELGRLVDSHRALGDTLRDQRLRLVQRELLLDTMVQNTPVAMLLVDPSGHVVLGNLAARRLLGDGRKLEGASFSELLDAMPEPMREAFARGGDGMFTVGHEDDEDIYHLSRACSASTAAATNWCCCASSPRNCGARRCRSGRR